MRQFDEGLSLKSSKMSLIELEKNIRDKFASLDFVEAENRATSDKLQQLDVS